MQIKETFNIGTATAMFVYGMLEKMGYNIGGYIIGTVFPQNESEQVFTLTADDIISSIFMIGGLLVLFLIFRQHIIIRNMEKKKPEQLVNDLIKEVINFNKKWYQSNPLLSPSYRKQIQDKVIVLSMPDKIHNHSRKLKGRIIRVKELKKSKMYSTLNKLTKLSDDIEKLSDDLGDIIKTTQHEKEVIKNNPELFEELLKEGDRIYDELRTIKLELEELIIGVL